MSGGPVPSLALLSAITALAFCGLHMVVPALPLLVAVFADTPPHVQLVVSLYLGGIGAGQLVYGPASDRFGRRPVVLAGLAAAVFAARCMQPSAAAAAGRGASCRARPRLRRSPTELDRATRRAQCSATAGTAPAGGCVIQFSRKVSSTATAASPSASPHHSPTAP